MTPRSWDGARIGRMSLRADAAYCALLGAIIAATAPVLAPAVGLPSGVLAGVGLVVVMWAVLVVVLLARLRMRTALRIVLAANVVATLAVAGASSLGTTVTAVAALVAIACDVGLFAGSQAVALRRLSP